MAYNYQVVDYTDIGKGLDTRSIPNLIQDGYSRDLQNVDATSQGHLEKRKGYQGYYGYLPIRVLQVQYTADPTFNIWLSLDDSINLSNVAPTPLIISGRIRDTSMMGDFEAGADSIHYYPTFTTTQPVAIPPGFSTLTRNSSETGINSNAMSIGLSEQTDTANQDNSILFPDATRVDAATFDVEIDVTNGTASPIQTYLYFLNKTAVAGSIYHHTITASATATIPAGLHNLSNFNILVQVEELVGGEYSVINPDSVTIDPATGEVNITLSSAITGRAILTSVPILNKQLRTLPAAMTTSVVVPSPGSPFNFINAYVYENPGDDLEMLMPESASYDSDLDELTLVFNNVGPTAYNLEIYYENADIISNVLKVTGTVGVTGIDPDPQLIIWGLPPAEVYNTNIDGAGHVNHIDSFKQLGSANMVAGIGGVLYETRESDLIGPTVAPFNYVNIRGRVSTDAITAPLFQEDGTSLNRSRGTIESTSIANNLAVIDSATYNSGTMWIDYVISLPGKAILNSGGGSTTLASVFSTNTSNPGLEDYLTVTQMAYSKLNGRFKIMDVVDNTPDASHITISVLNTTIDSSDYDETDAGGSAGVFTDQVVLLAASTFEVDDILAGDTILGSDNIQLSSDSGSTLVLKGIDRTIAFPAGVRLNGTRTSSTFPLRDEFGTAISDYLVKGDMLSVDDLERRVRIIDIDTTAKSITLDEELTLADAADNSVILRPVGRWYSVELPESAGDLAPTTQERYFDAGGFTDQMTVRSTTMQDTMYLTNYADEVLKFDGTNIYRSGLFRWKPELFTTLNTLGASSFSVDEIDVTATDPAERSLTVDAVTEFRAGSKVYYSFNNTIYTILTVDDATDKVFVDADVPVSTSGTLANILEYRYYFRLNAIDANNNIVASASTGSEDFRVQVTEDCQIDIKLIGMPVWDLYDYDRIELVVARTFANLQAPFFSIGTVVVPFNKYDGYIQFTDGIADIAIDETGDLDTAVSALLGKELPLNWNEPLRAKYITSAANKLVLGNLLDYPEWDISLRALQTDPSFTIADLTASGEVRWLFRKDNTDTGTTTNMVDRAAYEFVDTSGAAAITTITNNAGTSFTITAANALAAGDWVYLYHSTVGVDKLLQYSGWFQVASATGADFEINYSHDAAYSPGADDVDSYITATLPADIPVLLGSDGNYGQRDANLTDRSYAPTAMLRLANAMNSSMRVTDVEITGQEAFSPWLTAYSGQELGSGRLIVRQPKVIDTSAELVLDANMGDSYQVFINNIRRVGTDQVGASTAVFPSRLITSYANYAEIFDGPAGSGTSVIDINPADGQAITGIIPFFGVAAFNNTQKEAVVVAFKEQSIYIVDVKLGTVQRLDSRGLGCTAPYSITPTKNGIMFANNSGLYKLNYDLTIEYVGLELEGMWKSLVNRDLLSVATGHHHALDSKYQLSVPIEDAETNSSVLVYDHTREGITQQRGSWVRYTGFRATGWANLDNDAFFASTLGEVFSLRRLTSAAESMTNYRDDADAVAEMVIETKPFNFGVHAIRHKVRNFTSYFRTDSDMVGTNIETAVDLSANYQSSDMPTLVKLTTNSAFQDRIVVPVQSSLATAKFMYLTVKYTNSTKDEPVVLAGISFHYAPLTTGGVNQAAGTTTV